MEFVDETKVPKRLDSYTLSIDRLLTHTAVHPNDSDYDCARNILDARNLREKYAEKVSKESEEVPMHYKWNDDFGIFEVYLQDDIDASGEISERDETTTAFERRGMLDLPTIQNFVDDYHRICEIAHDKVTNSFCHHTLRTIQHLSDVHIHMHWMREEEELQNSKSDFFNTTKVDTHVHLSAAFAPLDLLGYMRKQITEHSDEIACKGRTLAEICEQVDLSAETLTLGKLGIQANEATFARFDIFNSKFTLAGSVELKETFLGYKFLQRDREGRDKRGFHLAELTKKAHNRLIEDGHVFTEWRVSITGSRADEWDSLADFMIDNDLHLLEHNKWMVQNPRLYGIMKKRGDVLDYGQILQNFFGRLFEATLYPERHIKLAQFLAVLSGFDSVDDESVTDPHLDSLPPKAWTRDTNPHYAYQLYYFWANIKALNRLRSAKGLNVFSFRPHVSPYLFILHSNNYLKCNFH
jgi:AMP deaminase